MPPRKKEKPAETRDLPLAPDPLSPFVGKILLEAREAIGMKQEVAAEKLGISDATLRKVEEGEGSLYLKYLYAICQLLKLSPDMVLYKAAGPMWVSLLEKVAQDLNAPPVPPFRKTMLDALDARQRAERKEIETKLLWESALLFKTHLLLQESFTTATAPDPPGSAAPSGSRRPG